jgi:hypothetical protein
MYEKAAEEMLLARRADISGLSDADHRQIDTIDLGTTHEFGPAAAKYERQLHKSTTSGTGSLISS